MGKALSKLGIPGEGGDETAESPDPEFQFRCTTIKALRTGVRSLMKSIGYASASMNTPARMAEVGHGFMAVSACVNHSGAGGVPLSTGSKGARKVDDDEGDDVAHQPRVEGCGRTKINRGLAGRTFESTQLFAHSMREQSEYDYLAYCASVEREVVKKGEVLLAQVEAAVTLGKMAAAADKKYAAAQRKVDEMERRCAKKGVQAVKEKNYTAVIKERDEADRLVTQKKDAFHESYEALMLETQRFSVECMGRYLELTASFNRACLRVMDETSAQARSRARAQEMGTEPALVQ